LVNIDLHISVEEAEQLARSIVVLYGPYLAAPRLRSRGSRRNLHLEKTPVVIIQRLVVFLVIGNGGLRTHLTLP
jgi:hypothetical protein